MSTIILILLLVLGGAYALIVVFIYFFQERLLFQAKALPSGEPFGFRFSFEEQNIPMSDGGSINGIFMEGEGNKGIILYFHGNAGDLNRWAPIAEELRHFGYHVLAIDYRGYGKSTGHRDLQRMYDDALEVHRHLRETYEAEQIIIYGRSIGCAFATWLGAHTEPKAVLLETPFYSIHEVLAFRFLLLPTRWLLRYPFNNGKYMPRVSAPIHIIHGTLDTVVPFISGRKLYERNKESKYMSFTTISGGLHNNLADYPRYWKWLGEKLGSSDQLNRE